jgi:hypothetical protein
MVFILGIEIFLLYQILGFPNDATLMILANKPKFIEKISTTDTPGPIGCTYWLYIDGGGRFNFINIGICDLSLIGAL